MSSAGLSPASSASTDADSPSISPASSDPAPDSPSINPTSGDTNAESPSYSPASDSPDPDSPSYAPASDDGNTGGDETSEEPMPDPRPDAYTIHARVENDHGALLVVEYESAPNYGGCKLLFYRDRTLDEIIDETNGVLDPHFLQSHPSPTARFHPDQDGTALALDIMEVNSAQRSLVHQAVQSIQND